MCDVAQEWEKHLALAGVPEAQRSEAGNLTFDDIQHVGVTVSESLRHSDIDHVGAFGVSCSTRGTRRCLNSRDDANTLGSSQASGYIVKRDLMHGRKPKDPIPHFAVIWAIWLPSFPGFYFKHENAVPDHGFPSRGIDRHFGCKCQGRDVAAPCMPWHAFHKVPSRSMLHSNSPQAMVSYMWDHLSPWLREAVDDVVQRTVGAPSRDSSFVGIHVRRGDKVVRQ